MCAFAIIIHFSFTHLRRYNQHLQEREIVSSRIRIHLHRVDVSSSRILNAWVGAFDFLTRQHRQKMEVVQVGSARGGTKHWGNMFTMNTFVWKTSSTCLATRKSEEMKRVNTAFIVASRNWNAKTFQYLSRCVIPFTFIRVYIPSIHFAQFVDSTTIYKTVVIHFGPLFFFSSTHLFSFVKNSSHVGFIQLVFEKLHFNAFRTFKLNTFTRMYETHKM